MKPKSFKRGVDFPHEGFVQSAIEVHFIKLGFTLEPHSHADLACFGPGTGERWLVEAKGVTTEIGLDFRTGLGQLVQRMTDAPVKYALAIPNDRRFLNQCRQVSGWVRQALGLHWLVVSTDGSVRAFPPATDP